MIAVVQATPGETTTDHRIINRVVMIINIRIIIRTIKDHNIGIITIEINVVHQCHNPLGMFRTKDKDLSGV